MTALEETREAIPGPARDLALNLQAVLGESSLSEAQRWGVAVASAVAARNDRLRVAIIEDAAAAVGAAVVEDGVAAAAIMGMNNVLYRFRHLVCNPSYDERPARLRMNRLVKPAGSKVDFELYALAASAVFGCGTCMQAHEKVVRAGGLGEEQVFDAIRIAATVHGAAVALDLAPAPAAA
jgi:alkyl hydroperoxide reductase subunit D